MNAVPSVILEVLHGRHGDFRRPCPHCDRGPHDVALSVRVDDRGAVWHCFRCDLVGSVGRGDPARAPFARSDTPRDALRRVWRESMPIMGSQEACAYLAARGLSDVLTNPPKVLRAHPRLDYFQDGERGTYAALVALVQDRTGTAVSIHRTYLRGGRKAPVSTPKKLMPPVERGACSRAAIRLYPISQDGVLAVAEGIESALSYWCLTRIPVWSCMSAGGLERFWIPDGVKELHVIEDIDPSGVGQHAAMSLFKRAASRWRRAVFVSPMMVGGDLALMDRRRVDRPLDMNDALRGVA
jgi:putative DNA primase/helicase